MYNARKGPMLLGKKLNCLQELIPAIASYLNLTNTSVYSQMWTKERHFVSTIHLEDYACTYIVNSGTRSMQVIEVKKGNMGDQEPNKKL